MELAEGEGTDSFRRMQSKSKGREIFSEYVEELVAHLGRISRVWQSFNG